jgi:hypothetical protein
MKKLYFILLLFPFFGMIVNAQTCQWAEKIAGSFIDYTYSTAIDANGNIYVAGKSKSSPLNFNNGISLTNTGYYDGYIAKYNSSGLCQWAEKIAGIYDDFARSITVDINGNIYIVGDFSSPTLNFNNGITLDNGNSITSDGFIAKYNEDGICQWAEKINGTDWIVTYGIAIDSLGNAYLSGYFDTPIITFNNGISLNNSGGDDGFIAKYNVNGICQWAQRIGGSNDEYVLNMAVDKNANVLITGSFTSSTVIFNNAISLMNNGGNDGFIAKYNANGICQWAECIYGDSSFPVYIYGVGIDENGDAYGVGRFYSSILNFNNGITLVNSEFWDGFIVKYNGNGICQWAEKQVGNSHDCVYKIAFDKTGNFYIVGDTRSTSLSFNNDILITNNGIRDGFLAKYNALGICQWAEKIEGANENYAYNLAINPFGNIYVTGYYNSDSLNFNNGISLTNNGDYDGFIAKYIENESIIPILISPQNNSTIQQIDTNIIWKSVQEATSYTLQVSTISDFSTTILNINGISDTSYNTINLNYNTKYFWRVNATMGNITSPWSEVWNFTTGCDPNATFTLSGIVSYNNTQGTPLSNCTVNLIDSTGYLVLQTFTDNSGSYNFGYVFPGIYKIEVSTTKPRGGLNILDVVLTRQKIAFLIQLSPLQMKTADVNMNNIVNVLDVVYMRQKLAFLNPPQWTIPNYVFEVPIVNLCGNDATVNIKALCAGDVNGSYVPQ